jgi:diguanylate cyclase (GGDEF)-like protein
MREANIRSEDCEVQRSAWSSQGARSGRRLFAVYAVASLLPVAVLGAVLSWLLQIQAEQDGLGQARDQAALTAVALTPLLTLGKLDDGLSPAQGAALAHSVQLASQENRVVRLRVHTLDGRIVFSSDGTVVEAIPRTPQPLSGPDDEVTEAAEGHVESQLTHLNADDAGAPDPGPRVVEVYQPLRASAGGAPLGVLEAYLPYEPIARHAAAGQRLIRDVLFAGLLALWAVLMAITSSVTSRLRRQVAATAFLAGHDPLTGLPNRVTFRRRTAATLRAGKRCTAIAVLDLDRFRDVNDTLGHRNGDALLEQLGVRLTAAIRPGDTIARLGGDEFGVVLHDLADAKEADEVLRRLRTVLSDGLIVDGLPLTVEASVGYTLAPDDDVDVDVLLRYADVAMYVAKRRHLGVARYLEADNPHDGGALALVGELPRALAEDELVLHYQPKTGIDSGRVEAVEALVRWQHPELGLLYPDSFIPAVEQTELIEPLTTWVLERALTDMATLEGMSTTGMRVAVNVSARSLGRPDFARSVLDLIERCGTRPERVVLEMTETALLVDPDRATAALGELAAAGIAISIDDFGAGQTSLGYLATLPVHEVKIDKQFVLDMALNPRNAAIVRSVVELAHSLGFAVTAEGVESVDALSDLRGMRCDAAQGYLLSRPVPLELLAERIEQVNRDAVGLDYA